MSYCANRIGFLPDTRGIPESPVCSPRASLSAHPNAVFRAEHYYPIAPWPAIVTYGILSIFPTDQGICDRRIFQTSEIRYLVTIVGHLCAFPLRAHCIYGASFDRVSIWQRCYDAVLKIPNCVRDEAQRVL